MDLAAKAAARLKNKFVMRCGVVLVILGLLGNSIMVPKAKAFALSAGMVYGLVGAFITAVGLTPVITGAVNTDDVGNAIGRLLDEYLTAEVGQTALEWAAEVTKVTVDSAGHLGLPRVLAGKLAQFAAWAAAKYIAKPGETNVVYTKTSSYVTLADGSKFYLCTGYDADMRHFSNPGTPILPEDTTIVFSTGYSFELSMFPPTSWRDYTIIGMARYLSPDGHEVGYHPIYANDPLASPAWPKYVCIERSNIVIMFSTLDASLCWDTFDVSEFDIGATVDKSESLAFDAADAYQQVLDRLSALEEGQSVALDVGATQFMELQDILQNVLDAILAGNIAATAEVVAEGVEPDPPPAVLPDVDALGLPALGEALTSRFPFCIPWDVYRGVQLLAAPAKAPYFEVDFMEPLAYRVGGWKGSTKIILDFSEYEIIGQVCRWTSTVGFCLMLAAGTKRLIWTA